jgi:hypothetical protein
MPQLPHETGVAVHWPVSSMYDIAIKHNIAAAAAAAVAH